MKKLFKKIAVEAALEAGNFIKSRLGKIKKISFKGEINLVTDVDRKAEALIKRKISKSFPTHLFLAEEEKREEKKEGSSKYKWVIDPLDGTNNFAHTFPFFCVSIALEEKGRSILGVVYDPLRAELFWAEEKKGAYLNNKKIYTSLTKKLKDSLLATGFSYNVKTVKDDNVGHFVAFLKKSRGVRRPGAAALDLCYVACGRLDGFWELDLHPWDTAAASLIVKEAGGKVTNLKGSNFSHYNKNIVASNGIIHKNMLRVIKNS
jgi:myo-inositol-1(or 4)-monophosphatase